MTTPGRHRTSVLLSGFAVLATAVLVLVSLAVADGATLQPGETESYDTEFMDLRVYAVTAVFIPVLGVAAAYSVGFALVGTLGVFLLELWGIHESNERLAAAGWADGLEVLAFVLPIGAFVLTLVLALIGGLTGWCLRRHPAQDQYTTTLSPTTTWSNSHATPS